MISDKSAVFSSFRLARGVRIGLRSEICPMISKKPEFCAPRVGRHGGTPAPKFLRAARATREEDLLRGRMCLSRSQLFISYPVMIIKRYIEMRGLR